MFSRLVLLFFMVFSALTSTNVIAQDLTITSAPTLVSGCNLPCTNPITITIYNAGPAGIFVTPVTVTYTVNGGPPVSESFSLTSLPFGAVYTYTFLTPANVCPSGTYTFNFNVNMVGDPNPTNNNLFVEIVNDTTVVGGTLLGSDTVCVSGNSGLLSLVGNTGYPDYWEYSTDGGTTWFNIADTTNFYNYNNLDTTTIFHVHLDGGYCPDGWSPWGRITVDDTTNAGFIVGNTTVCSNGNTGQLDITGNNGNILEWQYSTDGITWTSTPIDTSFYIYNNLTVTTYYQVWVQNGVCPPDYSTLGTITVTNPPIAGSVTADATVCYGTNTGSLALVGYSGTIQYWISSSDGGVTWTPIANTTPSQSYSGLTDTTIYAVILQNGVCPSDTSTSATITVVPPLVANAGLDSIISLGDTICLNGSGGVFYTWSPPLMLNDPNIQNPCIYGADTIGVFMYTLTATDLLGCSDDDIVLITVVDTATTVVPPIKIPELVISNFITPNSDGDNDTWNLFDRVSLDPIVIYYANTNVKVINNHGQIVYEKTGYDNTWKGDGLPDGSYYYLVEISDIDKTYKGVLTISSTK